MQCMLSICVRACVCVCVCVCVCEPQKRIAEFSCKGQHRWYLGFPPLNQLRFSLESLKNKLTLTGALFTKPPR